MPTRKALALITLTCSVLSVLTSLATYYITYKDPSAPIGGPTRIYHGVPLHWIIETWPMPRLIPGPVLPTFNTEPLNFLVDAFFYAVLFIATALGILHATKRKTETRTNQPSGS